MQPPHSPTDTGRRLYDQPVQSVVVTPTGAPGDGGNVLCDLQVEADRTYTGPALSMRSVEEPDAVFCEHDCVQNPICNFWSWNQVSDNSGYCFLFNAVTDYVGATSGQTWVSGRCSPTRDPTAYHTPGTIEVWVSRSLALFGTRAAVIDTTTMQEGEVTVRLAEGEDMADGRYVYVRSFDSNRQLRIDGIHFFMLPEAGRRLSLHGLTEDPPQEHSDAETKQPPNDYTEHEYLHPIPKHSWTRIYQMRNLTTVTCWNETNAPAVAKEARHNAAMLWADLSEEESLVGCMDCVTHLPTNCTSWFERPHGYRADHTEKVERKRRQMKEQLDRDEPERKRKLEEAIGSSCCKTDRKTGVKVCGREYCAKAFKAKADSRIAHTLRELHDRPNVKDVKLNIAQLVSTDMLAPHLHHNENCQSEKKRDGHGHIECIASSLAKHLGDKHGFSEEALNKQMDRYGLTVAGIMTAQLKHATGGTQAKSKEYESDVKKADFKSAMRRAEVARRKLGIDQTIPPRRKAPRASWIRRSTVAGRRLDENDEKVVGVERLSLSPKDLRQRHKDHQTYWKNQSMAAKQILKAGNLAVANNGAKPATVTNLMYSAWEASLATDSSIFGRMRSVAAGVGKIGERISSMSDAINAAQNAAQNAPKPKQKYRKLTEREEAYFQRVDDLVGAAGKGFRVPDHVNENWGWVTDAVDWPYWWKEAHRVGRILYNRHDWVNTYAEDTGTLPVGELPDHHKTGYSMLDINAPPTYLGAWMRSKVVGGDRHAPHRRLHEKRKLHELPRAEPAQGYNRRSLIGAFMDAAINEEDPLDAAWDVLQQSNDHHSSHVRRLFESATWVASSAGDAITDYGAKLAPVLFGESTGDVPGSPTADVGDPLRQLGRYVAYDTLLCYLYPPPHMAGGAMGDGTVVQLHYSNRACFPLIPYLPPDIVTFNQEFGLGEDFEFSSLEYAQQCDSATVKALIGPMMGDLTSVGFIAAPYGSLLRFAEGIDSLRNLGKTGDDSLTNAQRGSAIVCSIAQLGGLIWLAVTVLFLGLFCMIAPCGSWCCLKCFRICRGARRIDERRALALDDLINESYGSIDAAPSVRMSITKRRATPASRSLLEMED